MANLKLDNHLLLVSFIEIRHVPEYQFHQTHCEIWFFFFLFSLNISIAVDVID